MIGFPWEEKSGITMPAREGIFVLDGTGFSKQGRASVGVSRQYSGTLIGRGRPDLAAPARSRSHAVDVAEVLRPDRRYGRTWIQNGEVGPCTWSCRNSFLAGSKGVCNRNSPTCPG